MNGKSKTPFVMWMALAAIIILGGIGGFVYFLVTGLNDISESIIRVNVPGSYDLKLERAGVYTIFHETGNVAEGTVLDEGGSIRGLNVKLESSNGEVVSVGPTSGSSNYSFGSKKGYSLMEFEIENPGQYKITASFVSGDPNRRPVITIIQGFMARLFKLIAVCIAILLGSILTGALIVVLNLVFWFSTKKEPEPHF